MGGTALSIIDTFYLRIFSLEEAIITNGALKRREMVTLEGMPIKLGVDVGWEGGSKKKDKDDARMGC